MKIILFDEHPVVHDALQHFYTHVRNYSITGMYHQRDEFLSHLKEKPTQIVITDILAEDQMGLKWLSEIRKAIPNIIIIVYSSISIPTIIESIYEAGADVFVNKASTLKALHQALLDYIQSTQDLLERKKPAYINLTPKEKSIIQFIHQGYTAPEMAMAMGTSVNTINNQKNHIIKKFGCKTSAEVVLKLVCLGYISV